MNVSHGVECAGPHHGAAARWTLVGMLLLMLSQPVWAQEPQGSDLEIHDLSLWILEPGSSQANAKAAHRSALPPSVQSARRLAGDTQATLGPINLLTFYGRPVTGLDIDLRIRSGTFLAHWPPGEGLPNRLRWSGMPSYDLAEQVDGAELTNVDSDHWMSAARQGDALFVKHGARSERFLGYDAELNLPAPLKLEGGPNEFHVINTSGAAVYDVILSRPTPQGRRIAWIDIVPPSVQAAPQAAAETKPAFLPRPKVEDLFDEPAAASPAPSTPAPAEPPKEQPDKLETARNVTQPAHAEKASVPRAQDQAASLAPTKLWGGVPTRPAASKPDGTAPAGKLPDAVPRKAALFGGMPAGTKLGVPPAAPRLQGVSVSLGAPLTDAAERKAQTIDALTKRLQTAGLKAHEADRFVKSYGQVLFEGEGIVVVGRMASATMDEKIPLSVFPEPAKIVRVPIVVMRNADPQLGSEVDQLVARLGDPSYAQRQAAQKRLTELGPLAFARLQEALENNDPEIVIRAERILLQQNQTPNPQAKPKPASTGQFVPNAVAPPAIRFNAN
jgi:hypothetical protein